MSYAPKIQVHWYDDDRSGWRSGLLEFGDPVVSAGMPRADRDVLLPIQIAGTLTAVSASGRVRIPVSGQVRSVSAIVGTGPAGSDMVVDLRKNGGSLFVSGSEPHIKDGDFRSLDAAPNVADIAAGDYLTAHVIQIGSTTPGSDIALTVHLVLTGNEDAGLVPSRPMTPYQRAIHDTPGLGSYWRMNEAAGGTVMVDDNGAYNGNYQGTFTLGNAGLLTTESATTSMTSTATGVWVEVPAFPVFTGNDPFTFEGWFNPSTSDSNFRRIMDQLDATSGPNNGYSMIHASSVGTYFTRIINGSQVFVAAPQFPAGLTKHFAVTYDGTTLRLYVNGTLQASKADVRTMPALNIPLRFGNFANGNSSGAGRGSYQDFAVYNTALGAATIADHYIVGSGITPLPPPPPPPEENKFTGRTKYSSVALYAPLDETSGTTVTAQKKRLLFFEKGGWANGQITSSTPLDPDASNFHGQLWGQATNPGTSFNTGAFSRPVYIAPSDVSHIKVGDTDGYMDQDNSPYKWGSGANVAWNTGWRSADAEVAQATYRDRHIVLVDPTKDRLTEIFGVKQWDTGPGALPHRWPDGVQAVHGGQIDGLSTFSGAFPSPFGASGTGISVLAGLIRYEEILQGEIPHCIAFATSRGMPGFTAPATRGDQYQTTGNRFPEGGILTLDPSFDVAAWVTQQKASALTQMAAVAVQKYGMICIDASGSVSFYGEDIRNPVSGQYDASYNNTLWYPYMVSEAEKVNVTGNAATDVLTAANHGLSNGTRFFLFNLVGGTGLVTTQYYTAMGVAGSNFQASSDGGVTPVDFSTNVTGGKVARVQAQYQIFGPSSFPWGQLKLLAPPSTAGRLANTWNDLTGSHSGAVTVGQASLTTNTARKSALYAGGKTTFADDPVFDVGGACTLSAVVKPGTVAAGEAIILHRDVYELKRSGSSLVGSVTIGAVVKSATAASVLAANTTAHVAVTYDGANVQLYVNGVAVGSATAATGSVDASSDAIVAGSISDGSKAWAGYLQHLVVLKEALSVVRLAADYTAITT